MVDELLISKASARDDWKRLAPKLSFWPSAEVCGRLISLDRFKAAKQIGLFAARAGEVDLFALWMARPQACVFPRVARGTRRMEFFRVHTLAHLKPGFGGILEPVDGERVDQWDKEDWILVPGMAFDVSGARVGTGAGYYDRFLSRVPASPWGVAWESQIVAGRLVQDPTDVRMKGLCTESRTMVIENVESGLRP